MSAGTPAPRLAAALSRLAPAVRGLSISFRLFASQCRADLTGLKAAVLDMAGRPGAARYWRRRAARLKRRARLERLTP